MPLPLWAGMALGGAALGLAKNEFIDKPRAERMAKAEATKTAWSPWTGMQGQTIMPPSAADAALKWGATGGMMGLANPGMFQGGGKASPIGAGGQTQGVGSGQELGPMTYNAPMQPQQMNWMAMQQPGMYS